MTSSGLGSSNVSLAEAATGIRMFNRLVSGCRSSVASIEYKVCVYSVVLLLLDSPPSVCLFGALEDT